MFGDDLLKITDKSIISSVCVQLISVRSSS